MNERKRNYVVYFYAYFATQVIFILIGMFLPIYFFHIIQVNRAELAFIQIFAYSALFTKPLIAIHIDKKHILHKWYIGISSLIAVVCTILFLLTLNILILFGVFLGVTLAAITFLDVAIDKIMLVNSPNQKQKLRNGALTQLGAMSGTLTPAIIGLFLFSDPYVKSAWLSFFFFTILLIIPLSIVSLLLPIQLQPPDRPQEPQSQEKPSLWQLVLMSSALFFIYAEKLYDYPMEPWVLTKYGGDNISLIFLLFIVLVVLNMMGVLVTGALSHRFSPYHILMVSLLI